MKAAPSERPDPVASTEGFAVDAERVASLLDGRVRGAARDELLEQLLASDDDYHAFADAAAVLREAEPEKPHAEPRQPRP
jgi:hypothetical protein